MSFKIITNNINEINFHLFFFIQSRNLFAILRYSIDTRILFKNISIDTHMRIKVQKLREGTEYQSYRIALPKAIIESKKWEDIEFELEDKGDKLILKAVKSKVKK